MCPPAISLKTRYIIHPPTTHATFACTSLPPHSPPFVWIFLIIAKYNLHLQSFSQSLSLSLVFLFHLLPLSLPILLLQFSLYIHLSLVPPPLLLALPLFSLFSSPPPSLPLPSLSLLSPVSRL